jgi:CSLREA domain-containing protein
MHLEGAAQITGARGDSVLYVFSGKGNLKFDSPSVVSLPGKITAMAVGKVGAGGRFTQVLVGVTTANGSALLVLTGSEDGLVLAAAYPLQAPATAFAFGDLNRDTRNDAAIIAGGNLFILHGRALDPAAGGTKGLESVFLPFSVSSIALGSFTFDRNPRLQMALLSPDGSVYIVAHDAFNPRPLTADEMKVLRQARGRRAQNALVQAAANQAGSTTWTVIETIPAVGISSNPNTPALLMRTRISSHGSDDILVLNPAASQMVVVSHPNPKHGKAAQTRTSLEPGTPSVRFYGTGTPVAAVAVRVNIDARPGLIVLHQGQLAPSVMMPLPDPTFTVNTVTDLVSADPNACLNNVAGQCSLREAVMEANATSGVDTIQVPAGTYTLTIPRVPADDYSGVNGALDILDGVNITGEVDGSGNPTTIIQAGTTNANGIDKVFSINPNLDTAFDTSLTNLVIRYGRNSNSYSGGDDFGGAFDWEASGTGNLTVTNCTITDNSTVNDDGGGIYATNGQPDGGGLVTITNSTIQNNQTSPTGGSGIGGGLYMGPDTNLSMSNTKILNNKALQADGNGEGIFIGNPTGGYPAPSNKIHASTISGNQAAFSGGGIYTNAGLTVDQGTVISNNTAGGDGGGLWSNVVSLPATQSVSLQYVTITGNTASGKGGGIEVDAGTVAEGNNLSISYSRIAGNTASSGRNLNNIAASVTATNNWWGTNTPATTINGTVTFDPFIALTHTASPNKIRINQSSTLTGDLSKDNHGNGAALAGNLDRIVGLPITFNNAGLGTIPQAQPETLDANAQATATYNAGGVGGNGSADATVDQQTVTASIVVLQPPSISKSFSPTTVAVNAPSIVTFSITNGNSVTIDASFTDTLPTNLVVAATPNVVNGCGGTVTATAGT